MWFITVFQKVEPDPSYFANFGASRTWGYYKDRDEAVLALHENRTDMWEYLYDYALIEKIEEGICSYASSRQWFKYDLEQGGYFEIDEPECVRNVCNFAIG